jgi:hypothetical protein
MKKPVRSTQPKQPAKLRPPNQTPATEAAAPTIEQTLAGAEFATAASGDSGVEATGAPEPQNGLSFLQRVSPNQRARLVQQLQRGQGNRYAAQVIAQVQRACAPPAERPTVAPQQDPAFKQVEQKANKAATQAKKHEPAQAKVKEAQGAAQGPANDVASQAAAGQVDQMGQQQPGVFNKQEFVAAVRQAIEAITPQTQEQADEFKSSGKAGQVKGQVSEIVGKNKDTAQKDIKETAEAAPDTSAATPKPVTLMKPEQTGGGATDIGAASGMPKPAKPQEVSLASTKCETDQQMTEVGVTEEQLKKSNEPEFTGALDAKKEADANAATASQEFRAQEQQALKQAQTQAGAGAAQQLSGMNKGRAAALAQVATNKGDTKGKDEVERAKIATALEGIYDKTKGDVTTILDGMEQKVNAAFDQGERAARMSFENHVEQQMKAYKDRRYSGLDGPLLWMKDKLTSMPPEVNAFYDQGRKLYLQQMDGVIDRIANIVGGELGRAKARINQGRADVKKHVASLPKGLQKIGQEALQSIEGKFKQLDQDVDSRKDSLVQNLAQKYVDARNAVDERINQMKEANKGLLDRAKEALGGVIETIMQLKAMISGILSKAAGVIDKIIQDPIGFLGNLVSAVKMGLQGFVANIGEHLKKGLLGWLFGALAEAGIQLPGSFDLKGILSLVMQLLGLTYANLRARAVKLVGPKVVERLEQVAEVFKILQSEGPAGLWKFIKDKLSELKEQAMGQIKEFVITKVITAGITWLISMLNPASAFVKACKAIYDIVMFFIERGSQIAGLVNAILDSIGAIASGAIGGAAKLVENALGKAVPVAISFLASLLGLGGIGAKIRSIIEKIQKPVNDAIDKVVGGVLKGAKFLFGKAKGGIDWAKGKMKQGADWAKGKAKAAGDWVKGKKAAVGSWMKEKTDRLKNKRTTTDKTKPVNEDKQASLRAAIKAVHKMFSAPQASVQQIEDKLPDIQKTYGLTSINLVREQKGRYHIHAAINPTLDGPPGVLFTKEELQELDNLARDYASQIQSKEKEKPGTKAKFLADPEGFLRGNVKIGDVVEAAGTPGIEEICKEGGLTALKSVYLEFVDGSGTVIGGKGPELDFLILGTSGVQEIVSAKLKPKQFHAPTDKALLSHFTAMPLEPPGIVTYIKSNFGINKKYDLVESANVVYQGGRKSLKEFRSSYLSKVVVDKIVVTSLTPGPDRPMGLQLRVTEAELIDKVIELVKKYI